MLTAILCGVVLTVVAWKVGQAIGAVLVAVFNLDR
jgi:hypothetical protein